MRDSLHRVGAGDARAPALARQRAVRAVAAPRLDKLAVLLLQLLLANAVLAPEQLHLHLAREAVGHLLEERDALVDGG